LHCKNTFIYLPAIAVMVTLLSSSCDHIKQKTRDTIHKSGETVGKSSSEFVNGISQGVDQTFECKLDISEALKSRGLKTGKFKIADGTEAKDNLLSVYLVFDKDFKGTISAKAFDVKNQEYGRTKVETEGVGGEAKYFDFIFDKRTNIESKSTFLLE
jgi:hypothetical protein